MKYKGKVAIWYYCIIIIYNLVLFKITYDLLTTGSGSAGIIINILVFILLNLICIPFAVKNYVILESDCLIIQFGFTRTSISYKEMKEVKPSHNPIASSAASLDRIVIISKTGNAMAYIAVLEKSQFLNALRKRLSEDQ